MRTALRTLAPALALALLAAPAAQADPLGAARAEEAARIELIERISKAFVAVGGGSGIIVSADGEILTNDHVAGGREVGATWVVIRPGGKFEKATLVAKDPRGDIALLKLHGGGPYPYVPMADSDQVRAGDEVVALGNPFGFSKDGSPHVTVGVISAVHRYQGGYSDAIMTDTAINPGNSGGPLLDMQGRLIGINGRIAVRFGTRANTGVGYAIPTNQIQAFMPVFRRGGVVSHGRVDGIRLGTARAASWASPGPSPRAPSCPWRSSATTPG
jgi:S1-C subfamily serine protease